MNNKYDVIVIGAGIGGLTAAALLSKKGKKVLILEKNPIAGGYAVNFKRARFEFDASLHMINGCYPGGRTLEILKKCGVADRIEFLKPDYFSRAIFPDFELKLPYCDLKEYARVLSGRFPSQARGIDNLFREMSGIFNETERMFNSRLPLWLESILAPFKYPRYFSYAHQTFQVLLDTWITDKQLKSILAQSWAYYGLPPSRIFSYYFSYGFCDFCGRGGSYPKGGSQAFSNAFVEAIKVCGGDILLNSEVEKIMVEKNRATGVRTKKGEVFFADDFISNIDVRKTFCNLIGAEYFPGTYIKEISCMEDSISAFQLYLGLNVDLREKGVRDYEIFVTPDYDLNKQYEACQEGRVDEAPYIITIYSNLDCERALPGKSIVGVVVMSGYNSWKELALEAYRKRKNECAQALIRRIERIIPGFSSFIETMDIATPLTMERFTGNHGGALYGFSQTIGQGGLRRLEMNNPYVKNLYLASAWTRPGGGLSGVMMAGACAAEKILSGC